jgi:hypothetical protein
MSAQRAAKAALAASIAYLVGSLFAAPILISAHSQAAVLARPLVGVAVAAPAAAPAQTTTSSSPNLQAPISANAFGNTPASTPSTNNTSAGTNAAATPSTTPSDPNAVNQTTCAQKDGSFSWLLCPFFDGISHTFADGAQALISGFLAVQPLQMSGPLYDTWNNIRILADVSFVIIFMVLIFAQTLQFELSAYAIKKIIPKLVASALLVQFSYVLSSAMVDAGNVMGAGVGELIGATVNGGATSSFDAGTLATNLLAGGVLVSLAAVAWELAFPIFLMVIISVLAMILTLAVRYLILGALIILSPLAFAAWVLPNTERYFSLWLSTLVKLVLMYPIIIALLTIAADVNGLVPAAASTDTSITAGITTTIIKVLVFVACFGAIPQTFKWAGGAMAQAHGAIDGMRSWGHKKVHDSDNWKNRQARTNSRQIARANRMEAGLRPMLSSRNPLVKGAGGGMFTAGSILLAGRTGTSSAARQRGSSQLINNVDKELQTIKEASPGNLQKALIAHYATGPAKKKALLQLREQGAESLMDYTKRIEGRQAMVRRLADKNLVGKDVMGTIQAHSRAFQRPEELQMVLRENGKNIRDNPGLFARHDRSDPNKTNPLTRQSVRIGDVNKEAASGLLAGLTASRFGADLSPDTLKVMGDHKTPEATDTARQLATVFGESISPSAMQQAFNKQGRTFAPADKRAALLQAMARNETEFTSTPQGRVLWNTILNQVRSDMRQDSSSHIDAYNLLDKEDPTLRGTLGL